MASGSRGTRSMRRRGGARLAAQKTQLSSARTGVNDIAEGYGRGLKMLMRSSRIRAADRLRQRGEPAAGACDC